MKAWKPVNEWSKSTELNSNIYYWFYSLNKAFMKPQMLLLANKSSESQKKTTNIQLFVDFWIFLSIGDQIDDLL